MIINTNRPRVNMTRHEREERAAAAARKRHLNDLRDRVRASMVGMDETPADPSLAAHAGLQADALWEKVETNPRTGKRQKVKGREDCTSAPTTALKVYRYNHAPTTTIAPWRASYARLRTLRRRVNA